MVSQEQQPQQQQQQQQQLNPVYFAVGPRPHEVTCPYCKVAAKTIMKRAFFRCCSRRHYCSDCGEYLGTYRRPQL